MNRLIAGVLIIAGVIHLLPLPGVVGASHLTALYGVKLSDPNVVVLMRHRAVLFGMLGVLALVAAFRPTLQLTALIMTTCSVIAFLAIAWPTGSTNDSLQRVFWIDVVVLGLLLIALSVFFLQRIR